MLGAPVAVLPRRGFILVTEPLPPIIRHKVYAAEYVGDIASSDADLQSSAVVEGTPSGPILIGASRERVGFAADIPLPVLGRLAAQAVALFPVLAGVHALRAYRGFRPYCPDHLPVIGPDPRLPGLLHACGHEGAGIGAGACYRRAHHILPDRRAAAARCRAVSSRAVRRMTFTFDGRVMPAEPGQSVAAALWAQGVRSWRRTRIGDRPRGLFCGIGVCFDCLVVINGVPAQRACLVGVNDGDVVETQRGSTQLAQTSAPGSLINTAKRSSEQPLRPVDQERPDDRARHHDSDSADGSP